MSYEIVSMKFKVKVVTPDNLEAALNNPPPTMGFEMKLVNVFQEHKYNKGPSGGLQPVYRIVWEIVPIQTSEVTDGDGTGG